MIFMEKGRIIRSTGVVGAFTSLSRLLGLARDVLMAGFFGTSLVMSAFVVAFTIPNLFRRLFGEGALSSAFVPVLVETREKEGDEAAWALVNRVFVLLAAILTLITLAVILFAATASVASPKTAAVLELLQIMMPYMIFICLAAVSMGILWAILLAGFLQWAVQWPMLHKLGWRGLGPISGGSNEATKQKVKQILCLMGPAALGMAVLQLNVVIDRLLAMWVSKEAPAALFFSERLIYFPLGIIATALGTVLLPVFSGHAARNDHEEIRKGVTDGLRHLLFIMTPAAIGLLVLATPVVQMIFEWKEFSADSTWMTAIALQAYAPGLVIFSLAKIFVPAFYGMQDTKTPVKIGIIAVALNLTLNIIFILTLPQAVKHAGLAFATVLSSVFNMSCLALILQNRIGKPDWKKIGATAARSFGASALMASVVLFVYGLLAHVDGNKIQQIVSVLVSIAAGGGVYLIASLTFRAPELREFTRALRR